LAVVNKNFKNLKKNKKFEGQSKSEGFTLKTTKPRQNQPGFPEVPIMLKHRPAFRQTASPSCLSVPGLEN
jgi:hypothetical protein